MLGHIKGSVVARADDEDGYAEPTSSDVHPGALGPPGRRGR